MFERSKLKKYLYNVKSVPEVVDSVVQLMSSLPVTVNEMAVEVDVAADAAKVTVGGRLLVW